MTQLDFWSEELPANHLALQDYAKDLTIQEATLLSPMLEFLTSLDPSGAYGKMCQVSSVLGGGRDFGSFLGALGEIGYGWAYRVLDAQYFGVAQRRKRVFVVGYLGDWKPPAEILFESESLSGDIKKGRSEKKDIANCLTKSPASHSSYNPARGEGNAVVVKWPADKACTLNASFGEKLGLENQHINSGAPLFVQAIPIHDQVNFVIQLVDTLFAHARKPLQKVKFDHRRNRS
jgi:site-specific DNA-cytosine methylase